jgi:hypothetical protein
MRLDKEMAAELARKDLARRLGTSPDQISVRQITDRDFPDMSLGAPLDGEMSAQMISSGWQIELEAAGDTYEYRADKYQLRLHNYRGSNHVIDV